MIRIIDMEKDDLESFLERLKNRSIIDRDDVFVSVSNIIENVRKNGDKAVLKYTAEFDGVNLDIGDMKVSRDELEKASESVNKGFVEVIRRAAANIREFHERQKENSWFCTRENGVLLGQMIRPLEITGAYVPGGTAALTSSVLMNIIPAKVAGVKKVVMMTPPGKNGSVNPAVLTAAKEAGADEIFKAGGAQAIAAMAYGTDMIPKVDKITGPGNIYVASAKRMVFGVCDIDMIAGPSEIMVIADESADARYVAADLLSQAEHDMLASSILITTSKNLVKKVISEIERQYGYLERKDILSKSLADYGAVILVPGINDAVELANRIAPEHLELCIKEPFAMLGDIKNAGAVFLGNYSSEPLGDYLAGPNHVLPTGGSARFFSPLGVKDFMKGTSVISYSREAFKSVKDDVVRFAQEEGLTAHANAIEIRKD